MNRGNWALVIISLLVVAMVLVTSMGEEEPNKQSTDFFSLGNEWQEEVLETKGVGTDKIVVLHVDGVIADADEFSGNFSSSAFIRQLEQASSDSDVKGIVIRVDSPGGTVIDSDEIHNKIVELKEKGIKVGVSMGATAASGGYYISAPADFIYASPSTITGSLGVIFSIPNLRKTAELVGYSEETITSGRFKDIGNPLRKMTDEERAIFKELVDESYEQFVKIISEGREMSKQQVKKIADGRIYSGKQALKLKLVDELGTLDDALVEMGKTIQSKNYQVVQYMQPFSFQSLFGSLLGSKQPASVELLKEVLPTFGSEPQLLYLYR